MNWGKGLMIGMALFMGFILTLVITLMRHNVDLESEDYYERELVYNDKQEATANYQQLKQAIEVRQTKDEVLIVVPFNCDNKSIVCDFIRPNDKTKDLSFNMSNKNHLAFPKRLFDKGIYRLEYAAKTNGKAIHFQTNVIIQ